MSCVLCLTIYGFLGLSLLLPPLDAVARFTRSPPSKLYVVKGQTARFAWDYHVDDRNKEFHELSPRWLFYDSEGYETIGFDDKYNSWLFTNDIKYCPSRLLKPTVRVSRNSTATLVITNVTTADNGEYGCILVLSSGIRFPTSKAQLIVTETPMFTVRPNQTTKITEHSSLTINCTAVGPPTPNIKWVRERGVTMVTMNKGVGSAILSFANISRHDSGKYECQAVNNPNQSPVTASTVITVYYAVARFTRVPPSKLYVVKGQTARFVWDYHVDDRDRDFHNFSPRWLFYDSGGNKTIGFDNGYKSWLFTNDIKTCPSRLLQPTVRVNRDSTATLVITNVIAADNGEYGCVLVLSSGLPNSFPTSKVQLIVTETPKFTVRPNPTTITTEHSHLTISCTAVGRPTPKITWVRKRGVTKVTMTKGVGSARLSFPNISRHDIGKYECQAVNNPNQSPVTASTVVTVYYRPTIKRYLSTSNISSWNDHTVTLRCRHSSALPGPTWKWYRPNGDIITSNIYSITDGSEVTVVTGQDSGDYGRYRCKATNVAGSDEHSITVTQLYPPQGPPSMDVVCIQPSSAVIIWTRPVYNGGSPVTGYKVLVNSTTIHINTSNVLHHKEITGLHYDTVYEVKVLAMNIAGYGDASSKVFKINKQGINVNPPSTSFDSCNGAAVIGVLAFFFSVSLLVIIIFVVYSIWTRNKTNSEQENASVEMTSPTSYSAPNKARIGLTRDENRQSPNIPVVPNTPAESDYAEILGNPDTRETSQDHYQQLNPSTLQYDPTVQYEPLRTI